MKKAIKYILSYIIVQLSKTSFGTYCYQKIIEILMNDVKTIKHDEHEIKFGIPNGLNKYRVDSFSTKEPDTLKWIDLLPENSVLWDVGANIGLYSIYAAKVRNCEVLAFEPSVFNLELLARNIYYNDLQMKVTIIPLALSDKKGKNIFKMSSITWGGALSTFGEDFDQNGNMLNDVFEYSTVGVSMTEAVNVLDIPLPQHIKIDVDGIEHLILGGGEYVLSKVDSVMIEINDEFKNQLDMSTKYLKNAGLTLYKKCDLGVENQYNQWWVRKA